MYMHVVGSANGDVHLMALSFRPLLHLLSCAHTYVHTHTHRSTDQLMLTKVFTTHPRSTMPQCCLSVDYNSDSCPLNESSSTGSFVASSSTEKNGSNGGRNGLPLATKSLQQLRSVSPGESVCGWGGVRGGAWVWGACDGWSLRMCAHVHYTIK